MIVEAEMILIKNARVMDPESGFDQVTDILLDGKRIRQIGRAHVCTPVTDQSRMPSSA